MGKYLEMETLGKVWVPYSYEDKHILGDLSGTNIHLFSTNDNTFGACIQSNNDSSTTCCPQVALICTGMLAPVYNKVSLFAKEYGSSVYMGLDKYHLHFPERAKQIPFDHTCVKKRQSMYKWCGRFFLKGSCDFLSDATYDSTFCNPLVGLNTTTHCLSVTHKRFTHTSLVWTYVIPPVFFLSSYLQPLLCTHIQTISCTHIQTITCTHI